MFATLLIFYINRSESKKVVNGKKDTDFIEVLKMMNEREQSSNLTLFLIVTEV